MPLIVKDRVRENSVTSGTGTITLTGAVSSFQTFSSAIGNGNTTYYGITEQNTSNFEVGIGTVGAGTLTRDTVLESSNSGNLVNFGSAAKDVFCTYPAEKSVDIETPQTLTNKTISGASNTITNLPLTTAVTGVLPQANGGTGTTVGYNGFKNRIINGAMQIDQRNAGASVTPITDQTYTVDRWEVLISQASKLSVQQQTSVVPAGFTNAVKITSLAATSLGAGDYFCYAHIIEGYNIADLGWGAAGASTVTLSFWVNSSLTGTFGGNVSNGGQSRAYPFTYTISAANTWEQKTVTITGDTTGTWLTTNGRGIWLQMGLGVGTTYSGTAGSWQGAALLGATGATSVVGTNGATFYITGVQLEKGSTATSFDYRPFGTELALCQRYFQMTFSQGTAPASATGQGGALLTINGSGTGISTGLITTYQFPVEMRVGPSVVTTFNPSAAGSGWYLSSGASLAAATANPGTRGVTVYNNATSVTNTNGAIHLTCSAEL